MSKTIISSATLLGMSLVSTCTYAQSNDVKLGFGVDQGLGITGSIGNLNLFLGNDGFSADYLFKKESLKADVPGSTYWYVGAGAYHDWDDSDGTNYDHEETGVRLPVGVEWYFAQRLDAYLQISPTLGIEDDNNPNNNNDDDIDFGIDAAFGVRYKF